MVSTCGTRVWQTGSCLEHWGPSQRMRSTPSGGYIIVLGVGN
jgi:hypothetical protein